MQSLKQEYIESIAEKKLKGTITPEEQVLLDQWFDREQNEAMPWDSVDTDEDTLRNRLLTRIKKDAGISNNTGTLSGKPGFQRYRWSVAAAILLLIAGGLTGVLLFRKGGDVVKLAGNKKELIHDVTPGHSGAILALDNGNKIVLDSMRNGSIATQGNHQLIKRNGQITYNPLVGNAPHNNGVTSNPKILYNSLTTPRGREFQLILSDGTKVWLNAASSITYPITFTGRERKVTVTGEAYFEVAKDSRHPFKVSVGKADITVLGTHFDVMAYPDEEKIRTTLLEGAVKISKGDHHVIIAPGQQASFSSHSDHIRVAVIDTTQSIAWVKGKLSLNDLGVEAIMRRISRWYDVDVKFEGSVPRGSFWGLINRNINLSEMLRVMRTNGIEANLHDNQIIVSSDH